MLLAGAKIAALSAWSSLAYSANAAVAPGEQALSAYNLILLAVLVGGVIAYVIAQVRDYKPIKRLREDNAELRRDNDDLQRRLDAKTQEAVVLARSRDFESALAGAMQAIAAARADSANEHTEILKAIRESSDRVATALEATP